MVEYFLSLSPETTGILNIFSYLSTRTIISTLTGLLLVLLFGDKFIQLIKKFQFNQNFDGRAPQAHKKKDGTPTMGGVLIIGSVVFSGLIWGDLSNKYLLLGLFCLSSFAVIGFIDDYKKIFSLDSKGLSSSTKIFYQIILTVFIYVDLYKVYLPML